MFTDAYLYISNNAKIKIICVKISPQILAKYY